MFRPNASFANDVKKVMRSLRIVVVGALLATASAALPAAAQDVATSSDLWAAWSPVGSEIAFVRYVGSSSGSSVYLVRSDGSGLRQLYASEGAVEGLVWSPNGASIAFAEEVQVEGQARMRVRTIRLRNRRVSRPTSGYAPAWSPDGKKLALVRADRLAILTLSTGRDVPVRLKGPTSFVRSPAWSPDGRRLAITTGGNRVAVVSVRGGDPKILGLGRTPAWSRDGRWIAVACIHSSRAAFFAPARASRGCADQAIHYTAHQPRWAPRGHRVALSACFDPGEQCGIRIQQRGASIPKRITQFGVYPSWSRDGRRLVFSSARENAQLYLVNSDGTNLHALTISG